MYVTTSGAGATATSDSDRTQCVSVPALKAAVEQRLQRSLFASEKEADLRVVVSFERPASHWHANIDLFNARGRQLGHRRISSASDDCSGLTESLALVLALMIDLTKEDAKGPPPRQAIAPVVHGVVIPAKPREPRSFWGVLSLSGSSTWGRLPGLATGVELAAELRSTTLWSMQLGARSFLPAELEDVGTRRGQLSHHGVEAALCWSASRSNASELQLCAGPELDFDRVSGTGYRANHTAMLFSVAPVLRAQATFWPWQRVGVRLGLGGATPLTRHRLYATRADGSQTTLFRQGAFIPFFGIGLCLAL